MTLASRRTEPRPRGAPEPLLRAILDAALDAFILIDTAGVIRQWNRQAELVFGWEESEAIGRTLTETIIPQRYHERHAQGLTRFDATGQGRLLNRRIEITGRRRDGRELPIELTIAPIRQGRTQLFGAFVRDITVRKATEDHLRFQSTILGNVRDCIVVTDLTGRVQFWNSGAEAVFGYSAEEMVGRSAAILNTDEDSHRLPLDLQRVQDGEDSSGEWRRRRKDGTTVWIDSKRVVLRDPRGQAIGILAVAKDITERKRADEALQATHERLRDFAGRMRSVREQERALMARQIHDELGQVLTALGMDVAWLEARLPAADPTLVKKCRAMAAIIEATIGRVRTLATELRPAVLDDLGLLAAIEWETQQFTGRTGITCALELPATLPPLDSDRSTDLFRILQEALTNVVRHAAARQVEVQVCVTPPELILVVGDDGRGIEETEASSPRSLGLLGMRERALLWNGTVDIRARPQGGTAVTVRLPLFSKRGSS
ncbi:MAG: PAS domain-containing sensor histidine kinase [Candidatus Methylomirabilaceae bacterium]